MDWARAIESLKPYVVRVSTPHSSGTGFLVSSQTMTPICAVATAWHVVMHAHSWQEPIRIEHMYSGKTLFLGAREAGSERRFKVLPEPTYDTVAIVFDKGEIPFPPSALPLIGEQEIVTVGTEIGWLGFPALSIDELCFFSGRISGYLPAARINPHDQGGYLVDGVAINGVSGGPAFFFNEDKPVTLMGVVSAYIPNRATGEVLPGLSLVRSTVQFYDITNDFKLADDAVVAEHSNA